MSMVPCLRNLEEGVATYLVGIVWRVGVQI